jgi:uncharacterized protein (DUF1330 family)
MAGLRESLHVDAVEGLDADTPVVMLNLMKFRDTSLDGDGSGWDAYRRYSAHIIPLLKARGGTIMWAGPAHTVALGPVADGDWDYVALVWYPTPSAFVDMLTSADYAVGNVHRENGTERHTILALGQDYSKFEPASS